MRKPRVLTIAGSDTSGGAGIQADLATIQACGGHGQSIITAQTIQTDQAVIEILPTPLDHFKLACETAFAHPPDAIKLGMLYSEAIIETLAPYLEKYRGPVIADPVLFASSGASLSHQDCHGPSGLAMTPLLPFITLLTPNAQEAKLLSLPETQSVLITGGDNASDLASDCLRFNGQTVWLNQHKIKTDYSRGTGCRLSSSIATFMAQGYSLEDAIVLAKGYVTAWLAGGTINDIKYYFPWVSAYPSHQHSAHPKLDAKGRYPIVDNLETLTAQCEAGVNIIQLRIKNKANRTDALLKQAREITQSYHVKLIINDDIKAAIACEADGVHVGQEDILSDIHYPNNKLLGISAHNIFELAKAYAYRPSYASMGPIFETQSKKLAYSPIGIDGFKKIAAYSPIPLVAIGGLHGNMPETLFQAGACASAFIEAAHQECEGRFDRPLALPDFTRDHLKKINQTRVVCVGVGGLGSALLPYLVGAGIKQLTLIDDDIVSLSNLHRQVIYAYQDIGEKKVTCAKRYLLNHYPGIDIKAMSERLTIENAETIFADADIIIDASDNFATHFLIGDLAHLMKKPLVAASIFHHASQVLQLMPNSGCLRCLYSAPPPPDERPGCEQAGVLGTTVGLTGLLQADRVLHTICTPHSTSQIYTLHTRPVKLKSFQLQASKTCINCANPLALSTLRSRHMKVKEITCESLKEKLDSDATIHLLDVREDDERAAFNIGGQHIPIQVLPERIFELDPEKQYVVYCAKGGRSAMACEFLTNQGYQAESLAGGMTRWQQLFT